MDTAIGVGEGASKAHSKELQDRSERDLSRLGIVFIDLQVAYFAFYCDILYKSRVSSPKQVQIRQGTMPDVSP